MYDGGPGRGERVVPTGIGMAGCHAYPPIGPHGRPNSCPQPVVWTGVVLRRRTRDRPAQAWQVFACAEHPGHLLARRRLLPRDWERLAQWREHADRWRPGHVRLPTPDDPDVPPAPLAEGAAAHELIDRARDWERRQPPP